MEVIEGKDRKFKRDVSRSRHCGARESRDHVQIKSPIKAPSAEVHCTLADLR